MANNPYVNRVETADGNTIMDISDTTAGAGDVLSGEVFYTKSGARSVGTLDVSGYVTGPASAVDGHVAVFDGTTGKSIKDSGYTIGKSVPSDAVFTDTTYTAGAGLSLSSGAFSVTGMDTSSGSTSKCLTEKGTWASFTNNAGTITGITMNGASKGTSGIVDLGTVLTSHQDISGKANDNSVVHLTGNETIAGNKTFSNNTLFDNTIYFRTDGSNSQTLSRYSDGKGFQIVQYKPGDTSKYEAYRFPAIASDHSTADIWYVLTTRSAVTVPQGGTGATTAAAARTNLGAVNIAGDTMTGNLIIQKASGATHFVTKRTDTGLCTYLYTSDNNHGVYSNGYVDSNNTFHSDAKWLIYRNAGNVVYVNGRASENVLKSGDTMTGKLNIEVAGQAWASAKNTSTGNQIILNAGASGNHGISSMGYYNGSSFVSDDKWLIYRDTSNNIIVNGRATDNVLKTGDTMTGQLNFKSDSAIGFYTYNSSSQATTAIRGVYNSGTPYIQFISYKPSDSTVYENYTLPAFSATTVKGYSILTSKNAVTVAQGGTGATTADNAIANLNAVGLYNRSSIGTSYNIDTLSKNGWFEIRDASEVTVSGTRPFSGYGGVMNLKTPDNIMQMQLAYKYGDGLYVRGKQSANVSLANVAWSKLAMDAEFGNHFGNKGSSTTPIDSLNDIPLNFVGNVVLSASKSPTGTVRSLSIIKTGYSETRWTIIGCDQITNKYYSYSNYNGTLSGWKEIPVGMSVIRESSNAVSASNNKATFTITSGHHVMMAIAASFVSFFRVNTTLYNTELPSGFTASLSGDTVTISRSNATQFIMDGIAF